MLFYRAAVDLSRSTLNYVAGLIRRHRKAIGSTWRLLNPGRQALLVLVYLRKGETFAESARGSGCRRRPRGGTSHAKLRAPGERANAQLKLGSWPVGVQQRG